MKKILSLLLSLCLVLSLCACGTVPAAPAADDTADVSADVPEPEHPAEPVELVLFAAASMTEAMNEIIADYTALNPNVTIIATYDSSGTLKTQIAEGADCDIFISAGQKQLDQLDLDADASVNTEGLDFVLAGSRFDLLENQAALCTASNSTAEIHSFDDLAALLKKGQVLLALGNSDVPVGQYSQKILAYYELDETEIANAGKITYGSNVKEVTTAIAEGTVDCGIIYGSDAFAAGLAVTELATAEMTGGRVIYPCAVLNISRNTEAALAFAAYLKTPDAAARLAEAGFTPLN